MPVFVLHDTLDINMVIREKSYHFSTAKELFAKIDELKIKYEAEGKKIRVYSPLSGFYILEEM